MDIFSLLSMKSMADFNSNIEVTVPEANSNSYLFLFALVGWVILHEETGFLNTIL